METANDVAEIEYDGGGSMPIAEQDARAKFIQERKIHYLRNPDEADLDTTLADDGHVQDLIRNFSKGKLDASLTFYQHACEAAEAAARKDEGQLDYDAIRNQLDNNRR